MLQKTKGKSVSIGEDDQMSNNLNIISSKIITASDSSNITRQTAGA